MVGIEGDLIKTKRRRTSQLLCLPGGGERAERKRTGTRKTTCKGNSLRKGENENREGKEGGGELLHLFMQTGRRTDAATRTAKFGWSKKQLNILINWLISFPQKLSIFELLSNNNENLCLCFCWSWQVDANFQVSLQKCIFLVAFYSRWRWRNLANVMHLFSSDLLYFSHPFSQGSASTWRLSSVKIEKYWPSLHDLFRHSYFFCECVLPLLFKPKLHESPRSQTPLCSTKPHQWTKFECMFVSHCHDYSPMLLWLLWHCIWTKVAKRTP